MIKESIAALLFVTAILIATPICVADTEQRGQYDRHHGEKSWQDGDRTMTKTGGEGATATIRTECKDDGQYRRPDCRDNDKCVYDWQKDREWLKDSDKNGQHRHEDWKKDDDRNKWDSEWNQKHKSKKYEWNHKYHWCHDHKWNKC